jgi:negative regulator of sigma E activity
VSDDLERDLRRALRPVEPGSEFTERLLARVTGERRAITNIRHPWLRPMALAACVLLALGLGVRVYEYRQRERAVRAHAELIEALAVTSRSLDHAYRSVHSLDAEKGRGG